MSEPVPRMNTSETEGEEKFLEVEEDFSTLDAPYIDGHLEVWDRIEQQRKTGFIYRPVRYHKQGRYGVRLLGPPDMREGINMVILYTDAGHIAALETREGSNMRWYWVTVPRADIGQLNAVMVGVYGRIKYCRGYPEDRRKGNVKIEITDLQGDAHSSIILVAGAEDI